MLQSQLSFLNQSQAVADHRQPADSRQPSREALQKYRSAQLQAWLGRLQSLLTGKGRTLLNLEEVQASGTVARAHYAGSRAVPIAQIRGSEGRTRDFDSHFAPVKAHNRWRWLGITTARQRGAALPLVDLIQVGDVYYVRDGHHRISVARAYGEETIDAEVTVWELEKP
jgi:hypothetical protein